MIAVSSSSELLPLTSNSRKLFNIYLQFPNIILLLSYSEVRACLNDSRCQTPPSDFYSKGGGGPSGRGIIPLTLLMRTLLTLLPDGKKVPLTQYLGKEKTWYRDTLR